MARRFELANDLLKNCGALLTVQKLADYWQVSRKTVERMLVGVPKQCGNYYFYEDIADRLMQKGA